MLKQKAKLENLFLNSKDTGLDNEGKEKSIHDSKDNKQESKIDYAKFRQMTSDYDPAVMEAMAEQKRQQEKKKGNGRSGNIKMNFTFDDDMSEEDPDYRLDLSDSVIEADAKWSKYKFEQERT